MSTATVLAELAVEREKQQARWGDDHDTDEHHGGELAIVAASLAVAHTDAEVTDPHRMVLDEHGVDRWGLRKRKGQSRPRPARERLVIAAALLVAEIERLDRRKGGGT